MKRSRVRFPSGPQFPDEMLVRKPTKCKIGRCPGVHWAAELPPKGGEREVDLVSEDAERGCVASEVTLSDTVTDHDVRHLLWLKDKLGFRLKDAIVVNTGNFAYRRRDGIGVVPFALLGP